MNPVPAIEAAGMSAPKRVYLGHVIVVLELDQDIITVPPRREKRLRRRSPCSSTYSIGTHDVCASKERSTIAPL